MTASTIYNYVNSFTDCSVVFKDSLRVIVSCPNKAKGVSFMTALINEGYLVAMRVGRRSSRCYVRAFIHPIKPVPMPCNQLNLF